MKERNFELTENEKKSIKKFLSALIEHVDQITYEIAYNAVGERKIILCYWQDAGDKMNIFSIGEIYDEDHDSSGFVFRFSDQQQPLGIKYSNKRPWWKGK